MLITRAKSIPIERELERRGHPLKRVGGELTGPCPKCGGTDRFSVNLRKQLWNCRGCPKGGDIIDLVRHLDAVNVTEAVEILTGEKPRPAVKVAPKTKINGADDYEHRQREKARYLWARRQPITGSIAERYLREARGIAVAALATLAFLPPSGPEHHPAMIAAFALADEIEPGLLGEPRNVDAVHLTLLKPDGSGKADVERPKLFVGRPLGHPIVLAPIGDTLSLAIVEGVEDGLSLCVAFERLGVWAAGSAGHMSALAETIPSYVEVVTIWSHADTAGRDGAHDLATLLDARGIEVFIEGMS